MFVLDTDHVTFLRRADSTEGLRLKSRLEAIPTHERVTTIITFEEQARGWMSVLAQAKSMVQEVDAYRRLKRMLDSFKNIETLEFDEVAAATFQGLKKSRIRLGTMDLKIAAIALAHDATLLSRNFSDFRRVPGLKIEDWTL